MSGPTGIRTGPKCGAATRSGKGQPCRRPAGDRTDHLGRGPCSTHRGNTPSVRAKYAREHVAAEVARWQESNGFPAGVEASVSGPEVLLRSLARAEATVLWMRSRIALWNLPEGEHELDARIADSESGGTGMYSLTQYRSGGEDSPGTIGESERAAWLRILFDWEQFTAKTAAKVSQLGIQEEALRQLAAQAPNIEAVIVLAAAKLGLELADGAVRAAVAAAARELAPKARLASLQDVQSRAILSA